MLATPWIPKSAKICPGNKVNVDGVDPCSVTITAPLSCLEGMIAKELPAGIVTEEVVEDGDNNFCILIIPIMVD